MTIQNARRSVYLPLVVVFAFLLISAALLVSDSVVSFAQSNENSVLAAQWSENSFREKAESSSIRWITVAESEVGHIQTVVRGKGESFDLNVVEKHGELSVIAADEEQILDLTRSMHEEFHKCAGFMAHETLEAARLSIKDT